MIEATSGHHDDARSRPWRTLRMLSLPVIVISLAGCVVGPDYRKPEIPLSSHWGNTPKGKTSKTPELSNWWRRLGDQTLNVLIEDAVEGNLDVANAKAKIREARASYTQAVAPLFPSLDGSASAARSRNGSHISNEGVITVARPFNSLQAGFDSSWEIDLFGGTRRGIEAAVYGMDAAEEELRATLLTLIGDVAVNYVEARGYQARIALAQRTAASQRETAALTRTKFDAGSASAVDVANATGLVSTTEANIPALETSYAQAVHRLGVLTGREPTALAGRLKRSAPIPSPRFPLPTGVPADILLTRPDVRLAERQFAQATARIGQAEANLYPSISLTGSISTSGARVGDLAKNSSVSWSFGPSLSIPIFRGGELKAAVEITEAQRDQSYIAYRSSVLSALEDVENSIVALSQERIRNGKLTIAATAYRQAASLSHTLYQTGSSSFLDVLDAERSLFSAETSLIDSRVSIVTDYIALNKALGGGWNGAINTSKPEIVDRNTGPHISQTE